MSVEYDSPMSGPLPAPIAWVIFESSWPGFTVTLMFGWVAVKSLITVSIAAASRSVKKCHSSTVPDTAVPGSAIFCSLGAGVHAAVSSSAAAAATIDFWAGGIRLFTSRGPLRGGAAGGSGLVVADRGDQRLADRDEPGVEG